MSESQSERASSVDWESSQEIDWPPTPPKPAASQHSSSTPELSGREKRLRDIQQAIEALAAKRASDSQKPDASKPPLTKKPRVTDFFPTAQSSKRAAEVLLSQEQKQILELVEDGHSVFYTGSAGTGKSLLLREIIGTLRKKHVKTAEAVAITASTGISACNIGGITIHSFAGIGLGSENAEALAEKVRKNRVANTRWLRTRALIIDEVSMLDGNLFDKLSRIGSAIRKNPAPFGGIQIIVTGDFFQLPPVTKRGKTVKFAFEASLWAQTISRTFNLTTVFRQRDQEFVDMLNEMRFGNLSQTSIDKFRSLSRPVDYDDGLVPTELFPRREDVDRSNSERMNRLSTRVETFEATDGGSVDDPVPRAKLLESFMAVKTLTLREDAQVMLIKNMDLDLVNGSRGRVVRFVDEETYGTEHDVAMNPDQDTLDLEPGRKGTVPGKAYPVVEFALPNGGKRAMLVRPETFKVETPSREVAASRTQLPLILAWAMSIHKSQGQTLDRVKVDLGRIFEKGQAYVALSRATSLASLQVLHFDESKVKAHPRVIEWSRTLETAPSSQ